MGRKFLIQKQKNSRQPFCCFWEKPTISKAGCNNFTWGHYATTIKECLVSLGLIPDGILLEITARLKIFLISSTRLTARINYQKQSCTISTRQTMRSLAV